MLSRFITLGKSNQKGFSLIELSVVVSIAAASTVAFLSWTQPETMNDAQNAIETRERIERIERAIEAFRVERDRLPCPADREMRIDNSHARGINGEIGTGGDEFANDFGTEDLDEIQEEDNGGNSTFGIDCPVYVGAIPFQTLGLSSEYINDAWGRRFTYAVSPNICGRDDGFTFVTANTAANAAFGAISRENGCTRNDYENNTGNITVNSGTFAAPNTLTEAAAYVIVSHGANGLGAFLPSGTRLPDSASAEELENSNSFLATALPPNAPDLVFWKGSRTNTFDDITSFKTKVQIERVSTRSNARQVSVNQCERNSQTIKAILADTADEMSSHITGYDHTLGVYNTGEQVGLGLMMAIQDICISYYGYLPTTIRGDTWSGAQCPGNNYTDDGTIQTYLSETTYSSSNNVCTCRGGDWNSGNCEMDWFSASNLNAMDDLILWLDAETPETVITLDTPLRLSRVDNDPIGVDRWVNKTHLGPLAGQNAQTNGGDVEPQYISDGVNGRRAIALEGNARLRLPTLTFLGGAEIFGVLEKNNNGNAGFPWRISGVAGTLNPSRFPAGDGNIDDGFATNTRINNIAFNQPLTTGFIYNTSSMPNEWVARMNGIQLSNETVNNVQIGAASTIGRDLLPAVSGNGPFNGRISELLLFEGSIDDGERREVETYLGDKWDISVIPISSTLGVSPVMWLDADDESTLFSDAACNTRAEGATVACWQDKSLGGNDATQATANNRPSFIREVSMDYKNVVLFDTNDFLEADTAAATFNSDFTLFFAGDVTRDVTSRSTFIGVNGAGGSNVLMFMRFNDDRFTIHNGASSPALVDPYEVDDPPFILSATSPSITPPADEVLSFYNGVSTGTNVSYTFGNATSLLIGAEYDGGTASDFLTGHIGEVILYNQVLSDTERASVEDYLSDKWGIEIDNN